MNQENKLNKFLEGFGKTDPMQWPPGSPGDPQLAALHQYLRTKNGLTCDDVILDFGSGLGILATAMEAIWPDRYRIPWYYAVDQKQILDKLALSTFLHNHSQKIDADLFIQNGLGEVVSRVKIVVIRNVFHELDIVTTAKILHHFRCILIPQTDLYIQDIVNLPRGERARVGWYPDLLYKVLCYAGFHCSEPVCLPSFHGTKWFTLLAHQSSEPPPPLTKIEEVVASERSTQRERIADRLHALSATSNEATTPEYVMLQTEEATISTQLQQYSYVLRERSKTFAQPLLAGALPLASLPSTEVDYAEEVTDTATYRSGLVAVLSSKNLIDFPTLLASFRHRAYFMGYSQKSLLKSQQIKEALLKSLENGTDIRILLVSPDSEVTMARARSLAHVSHEDLLADIEFTRNAFKSFLAQLPEAQEKNQNFGLRLMSTIPPCSYFIIDDLCYVSLYSLRLSGGSGPCLVFKEDPMEPNAYFAILLQEFQLTWEGALNDA